MGPEKLRARSAENVGMDLKQVKMGAGRMARENGSVPFWVTFTLFSYVQIQNLQGDDGI